VRGGGGGVGQQRAQGGQRELGGASLAEQRLQLLPLRALGHPGPHTHAHTHAAQRGAQEGEGQRQQRGAPARPPPVRGLHGEGGGSEGVRK
jgi:hypothetical protein